MKSILKIAYSNKKIFAINSLIFLIFITLPPVFLQLARFFININRPAHMSKAKKANSDLYPDKIYSHTLFKEKALLEKKYKSYIGWRPEPIKLTYTTIKKPYNTRYSLGEKLYQSTWFFGGSTMWGWGVSDSGTIPSIYHTKTDLPVFNFGEQGWTSRQSLNQFISAIGDGNIPSTVIFYSGINDINIGCRLFNQSLPVHSREEQISDVLGKKNNLVNSKKIIEIIVEPYLIIEKKFNKQKYYKSSNCLINDKKSNAIASHLVNNWYSAYLISRANEVKFLAVLQPTIISSGGKLKNLVLPINSEEIKEYRKIYPLIKKEIKTKCLMDKTFCSSFIDASKWVPPSADVFIDEGHLIKEGNEIITNRLIKEISQEK